jgi:hypothetical protein
VSKAELLAFEGKADALALNLLTFEQSAPDLLSQFFYSIDHLIDIGMTREAGDICSRLSYLPHLLDNHTRTSAKANDPTQLLIDWQDLLQYLHFSELMPQVHKDYFDIDGNESEGFYLHHKDESLSDYEIRDILLADLSRPFCREKPGQLMLPLLKLMTSNPKSFSFPTHLMEELISFYEKSLYDLFDIPDLVYSEIAGCTAQEFRSFRNYMFAFSEFQLNMTSCVKAWNPPIPISKANMIMQSIFCFMPSSNLLNEIQKYTKLDKTKIANILQLFTLDFSSSTSKNKSRNKHSGDGYFPPIIKIDNGYCVPPRAVKSSLSNRNLIFAFQKQNPATFNSVVSSAFEPSLIELIAKDLSAFSDIEVRLNHSWAISSSKGEIDILVYSAKLNKILVVQVKAVIPPQGARMVRNVQSRILEGIEQTIRFRELSTDDKERIISDSLGFQVSNLDFDDVILSSSCLGSAAAWSQLETQGICGINYLLFKLLAYEAMEAGDSRLLFDICSWTHKKIKKIMCESKIQWEDKEFNLFGTTIRFPTWSIDEKPLNIIRNQILEARTS